jgi:hypothetical protein
MTDHRTTPPRPLWTDEDLDRALDALHADDATGRLDTARATLDDALAHQGVPMLTASRDHDAAPPPARRRRWLYASIAAGVAVVAAAAVALTGPFGEHQSSQHQRPQHQRAAVPDRTTVATVPGGSTMRAAAVRTLRLGDPKVGPGQYLYVKDVAQNLAVYNPGGYQLGLRVTGQTEKWVPYDQSAIWVQHYAQVGQPKWVIGTPEQIAKHGAKVERELIGGHPPAWTEAACGDFYHVMNGGTARCVAGNEVRKQPNTQLLKQVPRDPKAYLRWAAGGATAHPDDAEREAMQTSAMLLSSGIIPAELRATIYRALATLPDLKVTERVANLNGTRGTALGIDSVDQRQEVIIDPDTGQYLGARSIALSGDDIIPPGTVTYFDALTVAVVDQPRQRP